MVDDDKIIAARRALGRQLADFRQAAGYGQEELAPLVHYSRSSLANVEVGRQKGSAQFWQTCDTVLATGGLLLAAFHDLQALTRQQRRQAARRPAQSLPEPDDRGMADVQARVTRAAHQSQAFLAEWDSRCLAPQTVADFAEDLSRLAADYVHQPVADVFDDLVAIRDRAYGLLGERRRTGDTRDLLFVAGVACGLLAHASIDLGDRRSAGRQARVAVRLAAEAGHTALLAWVLGTQSLIAYCLRLPDQAVASAHAGETYASSTTSKVRLAALKARGYAAGRNVPAARQALADATAFRDQADVNDDLDTFGGILAFPVAKQHYYAASTAALVADGVAAQAHAQHAIAAYESGPAEQCSYGDLALSRVYLAQAQLLKPKQHQDPTAAAAALQAVLALPPSQRIAGLQRPLRRLQTELDREPLRHAADARSLRADIDDFLSSTRSIASA
jgi:DNA-binding XRE family transcriptional regulator